MRSGRDSDVVAKSWQKAKTIGAQEQANTTAIARMQIELNKLRRRILGGGGTEATPGDAIWLP